VNNINPLLRHQDAVHFDQVSTPLANTTPHATASKDSVENKNIMGEHQDDADLPDHKIGIIIVDQEGDEIVDQDEGQTQPAVDKGLQELQERLKYIQTTKLERIEEMMRRHERRRKTSAEMSEERRSLKGERRTRTAAEKLSVWGARSNQKGRKSTGSGQNCLSQK
jgi:hypothetical protein